MKCEFLKNQSSLRFSSRLLISTLPLVGTKKKRDLIPDGRCSTHRVYYTYRPIYIWLRGIILSRVSSAFFKHWILTKQLLSNFGKREIQDTLLLKCDAKFFRDVLLQMYRSAVKCFKSYLSLCSSSERTIIFKNDMCCKLFLSSMSLYLCCCLFLISFARMCLIVGFAGTTRHARIFLFQVVSSAK